MQTFSITGPFDAKGPGDTPSRRRIFTCHTPDAACAKQIVSTLAARAYRRPVTESDLAFVGQVANLRPIGDRPDFEAAIETALQRILASPKFIFRVERDPPGEPSVHRITDVELASRLSFFLWSSIPDDELLSAAIQGQLQNPTVLERQVRRMLADPKAEALVANFAGQWLHLRNVPNVLPNSDLFPDFDDNLRQSMRRETELFFESIIREDHNVLDLLTADYTFVNERLARHYGIPDIYGSRFRRVAITDDARKGLLGQASILSVTSHAERTSPVVRGKFILENILGTPVPPPPPDVPLLKETAPGETPKTMREQMAEHRANPACATCHKIMDPIGFALENFDAVGEWRMREAGGAIDASGELADGTKIDGAVALRQALVRQPEMFAGTLTEKLLTYGVGPRPRLLRHAGGARDSPQFRPQRLPFLRHSNGNRAQRPLPNALTPADFDSNVDITAGGMGIRAYLLVRFPDQRFQLRLRMALVFDVNFYGDTKTAGFAGPDRRAARHYRLRGVLLILFGDIIQRAPETGRVTGGKQMFGRGGMGLAGPAQFLRHGKID